MFNKFNDQTIQAVWEKGVIVPGIDPSVKRKDACGAWIVRNMLGDRSSQYNNGWEVDHIIPESRGGNDLLSNLQPLQWYNNVAKGDGPLKCPVSAAR